MGRDNMPGFYVEPTPKKIPARIPRSRFLVYYKKNNGRWLFFAPAYDEETAGTLNNMLAMTHREQWSNIPPSERKETGYSYQIRELGKSYV